MAVHEAVGTLTVPPRVVVVGEASYDRLRAAPARPVPRLQDTEKLAALLYTSGTSGRPRAAMLTHRALLANLEQVAQVDPPMIRSDDVVLAVLPLSTSTASTRCWAGCSGTGHAWSWWPASTLTRPSA